MAYAFTFLHTPQGYSPAMLEATLGVPVSIHLHSPEKRHIDRCRVNISETSATPGSEGERESEREVREKENERANG